MPGCVFCCYYSFYLFSVFFLSFVSIIQHMPLILKNFWPLFLKFLFCALLFPIEIPITPKLEHLILYHSSWMFFPPSPCLFGFFPSPFCFLGWVIYIDLSSNSLILSLAMLSLQIRPSLTFFISVIELLITSIYIWFILTTPSLPELHISSCVSSNFSIRVFNILIMVILTLLSDTFNVCSNIWIWFCCFSYLSAVCFVLALLRASEFLWEVRYLV